jgi:hypothetical protein
VFKDERGQDYVSTTLPMRGFEASQVRAYKTSGPYMPIGFLKPKPVGDADTWMADLMRKGFTFEPSVVV